MCKHGIIKSSHIWCYIQDVDNGILKLAIHTHLWCINTSTLSAILIIYVDCHSMEELEIFITESVIMKGFKHRNVLGLVGVSVGVDDEIAIPYIILPYMANGDLKGYLKEKRIRCGKDLDVFFKVIMYFG